MPDLDNNARLRHSSESRGAREAVGSVRESPGRGAKRRRCQPSPMAWD